MSLTYFQLLALRKELHTQLVGKVLQSCQSSDRYHFILKFDDEILLLCIRPHLLRFHLSKHRATTHSIPFTELIEQLMVGGKLSDIQLLNEDRILDLHFQNRAKRFHLICEFFSKNPNLYLLDDQMKILGSVYPTTKLNYEAPLKPKCERVEASSVLNSAEVEALYLAKELDQEKQALAIILGKEIKKAELNRQHLERELEASLRWELLHHEALLLQSNLYQIKKGMEQITIADWNANNEVVTIKLDPTLEPYQEVAKRFQKSKKLHLAIPFRQKLIAITDKKISDLKEQLVLLDEVDSLISLRKFQRKSPSLSSLTSSSTKTKEPVSKRLPYREFFSASGLKIWVGKTAKDNDLLTFHYANGRDWWLHLNGTSGAHVIIKVKGDAEPDQEAIQDAIQLALHYSNVSNEGEYELCLAQRKFVRRYGKGQAGKVHLSKHRLIYAHLNKERLVIIKNRSAEHKITK